MAEKLDKRTIVGELGEIFAQQILLEQGILSQKMDKWFDFDLFTSNHLRIEVKTATPGLSKKIAYGKSYNYKRWQFRNYEKIAAKAKRYTGRMRKCDFYILICLDSDLEFETAYVIPNEAIQDKYIIWIVDSQNSQYSRYRGAWSLLSSKCMEKKYP